MLQITKTKETIRAETGGAVFEWDLRRGGQLVRCDLKAFAGGTHSVLSGRDPAPNLTLDLGDRRVSLAEVSTEAKILRQDQDCFIFTTQARLADAFTVQQRFEVFPEGVVFCEFGAFLDDGKKIRIRNAELGFALELGGVKNMRQNYVTRDLMLKQDVTCVHVLPVMKVSRERNEPVAATHLLAMYGLDLGWDEARYFSNKVELVIEDSTSIGAAMNGPTRTTVTHEHGRKVLRWHLCENLDEELSAPFFYRNKWGLFCGAARQEAGAAADPARRNNLIGARVCHVMYPYVRAGDVWPWTSIPIKQVWYQDAQIAKENPSLSRIDEAARCGCNVVILHQFWMRNGGSNGEPAADYQVFDPNWFKATVKRAHAHGMRVSVYMRGIEHYSLYQDFFETYLKRNWDGLYVDWATPFGIGFGKASTKHYSIHNWFTFTRALRQRVGPGGFLIGHAALQTHVSYAAFDVTLTGEFSVLHSGLLAEPEISASYSGFASTGVHLMAGNAPDRIAFSSQRAAGLSAGLGYGNHPFMEPKKDFKKCAAYIQPLWDLFRAMGADPVRSFNPGVGTGRGVTTGAAALHPIVYQAADGTTLINVTNLSDQPVSGTVDVDFVALGLAPTATMNPLPIKGTHLLAADGHRIRVDQMPPYFFGGVLIAPPARAKAAKGKKRK